MPTKFFYGQDQSSLQPAEVLQSSVPLPLHITYSKLLFIICAYIRKKDFKFSHAARVHNERGCLHSCLLVNLLAL